MRLMYSESLSSNYIGNTKIIFDDIRWLLFAREAVLKENGLTPG